MTRLVALEIYVQQSTQVYIAVHLLYSVAIVFDKILYVTVLLLYVLPHHI
jgi:hypothetical protein